MVVKHRFVNHKIKASVEESLEAPCYMPEGRGIDS
jgi:hypothetical protein